MSFASFLSSPTVRIRIPPSPHSDEDEKFYTVHRSLLKNNTNLLSSSNIKPRETLCTLPSSTSPAAFEAVLEHLYTGHYVLAEEYEYAESQEPTPSPVLQAAMKGAIGVWGKPAAIHDDTASKRNISSYQSELFPNLRNGYSTPSCGDKADIQTLPSPPPSPKFAEHEPVLTTQKAQLVVKRSTPASRLAAHLEVYALARCYAVKRLAEVALENIKKEVVASPEILHELVRVVYGTKQRNEDLRAFVVGIVKDHWEQLRNEKVFALLLKEGGEFVLDVFSNVKGF
ncbi:hypothetical protein K440DRAFT_664239 [Wilcoxina mikolae CBS 423.85]|nr:hypothetical protein K440DRAFT_664239 [Wilcoxina mikolae CBS 423.85]